MLPLTWNSTRSVPEKIFDDQSSNSRKGLEMANGIKLIAGGFMSLAIMSCGIEAKQSDRMMFDDTPQKVRAVGLRRNLDPLSVAIDAERWGVIISNAQDAMQLKHKEITDDELVRIDFALRSGVRDLLKLRDELCLANEKQMETCIKIDVPDWVMNPPNKVTSLAEYQARSEWLGEAANNLSAIGCQAGREVSEDPYLCAVE